jgi:hypothetical protein
MMDWHYLYEIMTYAVVGGGIVILTLVGGVGVAELIIWWRR